MILTLILIAIMALVTVELLEFLGPRRELSREVERRQVLQGAAETGIEYARRLLAGRLDEAAGTDTAFDHLESPWAAAVEFALEGVTVAVTIEDEERRLPLDFLVRPGPGTRPRGREERDGDDPGEGEPPDEEAADGEAPDFVVDEAGLRVFGELLRVLEMPDHQRREMTDTLADWVEAPEFTRRGAGAGRAYYRSRGYEPRGGRPLTTGELALIRGFDGPAGEKLVPLVSPHARRVNLNTAREEVLRALARPAERLGMDFIIAARPYENLEEVGRKTGRDLGRIVVPEFRGRLGVRSQFFSVRARAVDTAGRSQAVYAVLERHEQSEEGERGTTLVYWQAERPGFPGLAGSRDD